MNNSNQKELIARGEHAILGTYKRYDIVFSHGKGSYVYDTTGKKYLDCGTGIAVLAFGHGNEELASAIYEQAKKLTTVSNLFYTEPQIKLCEKIVSEMKQNNSEEDGRVFLSNSGAEANECIMKLARAYGQKSGRFEIITTINSFHGRTFAAISASGQDKLKVGFEPLLPGFKHVPFNDLEAMKNAITDKTVAIMIEGIQGEGGIIPATKEYLLGLQELAKSKDILIMIDAIQCGFYRTGRFQSYERILESKIDEECAFIPDAVSMAKGIGAGFPIGASWINGRLSGVLKPGSHGTTFGGNALSSAASLTAFNLIEKYSIKNNVRTVGSYLTKKLEELKRDNSSKIKEIRGLGLMLGIEFIPKVVRDEKYKDLPYASYVTKKCLDIGLLVIPAAPNTIRILPQLGFSKEEADEAISLLKSVLDDLDS